LLIHAAIDSRVLNVFSVHMPRSLDRQARRERIEEKRIRQHKTENKRNKKPYCVFNDISQHITPYYLIKESERKTKPISNAEAIKPMYPNGLE